MRAGRCTVGLRPAKRESSSRDGGLNRCMRCIRDTTPSSNRGMRTLDPHAAKSRSEGKPTDVSDPSRWTVAASSNSVSLNQTAAFHQTGPWCRLSNKRAGSSRAIPIFLNGAYGRAQRIVRSRRLQALLHHRMGCRMAGRNPTPWVRPNESLGVLLHVRGHHLLPHIQRHIIS